MEHSLVAHTEYRKVVLENEDLKTRVRQLEEANHLITATSLERLERLLVAEEMVMMILRKSVDRVLHGGGELSPAHK